MATEEDLPQRTPPLIEIGPDFLGTGNLPKGIELPTGAVWLPALWVFGSYRTALNYHDNPNGRESLEWANRLELFANLRLSGTERILFGMQPLHRGNKFTGRRFEPGSADGGFEEFNARVSHFFAEGEIAEIFPRLDPDDRGLYDLGFTVGRQPILFQDGLMINDSMDVVSLTRDTIMIPGFSIDTRVSALWAFHEVNREDNREDNSAQLFGLFSEGDWGNSTLTLDAAYVNARQDGLYLGLGSVQRVAMFGKTINTDLRANVSLALEDENARVSDGLLLFGQFSTTPTASNDILYLDAFYALGGYNSASRDGDAGGPLGRTGILFAAVGLGDYGPALSNRADDVVGAALGYQMFWNNERTQLILEAGGRVGTDRGVNNQGAVGARLRQAISDRYVLTLDGFLSMDQHSGGGAGLRAEFSVQF